MMTCLTSKAIELVRIFSALAKAKEIYDGLNQ